MKNKKIIVGIIGILSCLSISFGADLRILPSVGSVGKNCELSFDVYLGMDEGDEGFSADLIFDSNMEFVNFENDGLFDYYIPPKNIGESIHIMLMNSVGHNTVQSGTIGKIWYKVVSDETPYINLYFNGIGDTTDTNVSIDGGDILKNVYGGSYTIASDIECETYTGKYYDVQDFDDGINQIIEDFDKSNYENVDIENNSEDAVADIDDNHLPILLWTIVGVIVLIIFLVIYKTTKKGENK